MFPICLVQMSNIVICLFILLTQLEQELVQATQVETVRALLAPSALPSEMAMYADEVELHSEISVLADGTKKKSYQVRIPPADCCKYCTLLLTDSRQYCTPCSLTKCTPSALTSPAS